MELTSDIKHRLLDERISSIDLYISAMQEKIAAGEENKEGLPSFEEIIIQETLKKAALVNLKEGL